MNHSHTPQKNKPLSGTVHPPQLALKGKRSGSVLIGVLVTVVVVTSLVGVSFVATNSAARMGGRAKEFVGVQRAAEATVEYGYGIWKQRIFAAGRPITTAESNASLTGPSMSGFTYASAANNGPLTISATDEYGAPTTSATRVMTSLSDYPGWKVSAAAFFGKRAEQSAGPAHWLRRPRARNGRGHACYRDLEKSSGCSYPVNIC